MTNKHSIIINESHQTISLHDYITSDSIASQNNEKSRINLYENWLHANNMDGIIHFDLVAYKHYLMSDLRESDGLSKLSRTSASAHINSLRARYLYMLDTAPSKLRDYLYLQTASDASPADRKAYVDEMLLRIRERVKDKRASVQLVTVSDRDDNDFIRLDYDEMLTYCASPLQAAHVHSITGVRDSAILTILCMTGIREDELVSLEVQDLERLLGGHPALEVRFGKGAKQRMIPYGVFYDVIMKRIKNWCQVAEIETGYLFRSLTKWGTVRKGRIAKRTINEIVGKYSAYKSGEPVRMKPHDCRRTYARILRYEFNMPIEAIADNLGHSDTKTTQAYVGEIDVHNRVPQKATDLDAPEQFS